MFDASAEFYDLIYSQFKDYAAEVEQLTALLRREHPGCASVLDVACGTGEHARLLANAGYRVDGLDLNPAFLGIARSKHPAGSFVQADMRNFHLPNRYDAIFCLFSSIGYVRTLDGLAQTLACCREHLTPGGILVVEPWFPPGVLEPGRIATNTGEAEGVRVTRVSRVEVEGALSRLLFDYEIVDRAGVRHLSEVHESGAVHVRRTSARVQTSGASGGIRSERSDRSRALRRSCVM